MKRNILLTVVSTAILTAASIGGETHYAPSKGVVPPAPVFYGTGFYMGLQGGINAYQDLGGTRRFNINGNDVSIEPKENIGGVGGLKIGYVFGTGTVRPAIEADLYYNGFQVDLDARVNGQNTKFNAEANVNSGAFLANFMVRFAFDRFQPYVGAGVGGYYASVDDVNVTARGTHFSGQGGESAGLAWQIIGGADYYFTEKFSIFAEYKYLNYEDPSADFLDDRIDQHLVVLGFRWHF